jgi:class 3 adenylate cyclase/FixJ family two-component response regulator
LPSARILVVGGREEDRRALETILSGAGLSDVKFAASSSEGLEALTARNIDVMLLDVLLPGNDVLELLRSAAGKSAGASADAPAKSAGGARIPVIVMGPFSSAGRMTACLQRGGAEDYLITPFEAENGLLVTRRIALCLDRRRLRDFSIKLKTSTDDPQETAVMQLYSDASTRFVPREFLENLERKSLPEVKLGDHVERNMTVFFSDIRDFTTLSEGMTPEDNFKFLNSYLRNANPIIRAHRGFIDKYIGDAIMALFPNAQDALEAALDLQKQVVKYNLGRRLAGYEPIRIGVGIHRGDLILGTIGEEERMQTTVIADAVNVASRLEGLTKTYGVPLLISGTVVDSLEPEHTFKLRGLGAVKAKGKTQSVEVYECYNNDDEDLAFHKDKTNEAFTAAMNEFRKGMFLTAGRVFAHIAEMNPADVVAAFYRDRCTLTAIRDRGPGAWDGAEKIEVK